MSKKYKYINYFLFVCLILSIAILVYQGSFNTLRVDDFEYGKYTYNAWKNTHNILEVLKLNFDDVLLMRQKWQGTYFALFIMKLCPQFFNYDLHWLTTLIILIIIIISNFLIIKSLEKLFSLEKSISTSLILLISLFQINCMPSVAEGIYWWVGGSLYLFSYLYFSIIIYCITTLDKHKILKSLIIMFFLFAIEGSSWPGATLMVTTLFFITIIGFIKKDKNKYLYLFFLIFACFWLIFAFTAPGNFVRKEAEGGASMPVALIESFIYSIVHLFVYFNTSTLCICLLFAYGIIKSNKKDKLILFKNKYMLLAYWCTYSAAFAPAIYGENYVAAPRYLNLLYLFHLVLCLLLTAFIVLNLNIKINHQHTESKLALLAFLFFAGFFNNNYADPASITVLLDTINQTNTQYKEVNEYNRKQLESDDKTVTLISQHKSPRLFMQNNYQEEWVYNEMLNYYNKTEITFD